MELCAEGQLDLFPRCTKNPPGSKSPDLPRRRCCSNKTPGALKALLDVPFPGITFGASLTLFKFSFDWVNFPSKILRAYKCNIIFWQPFSLHLFEKSTFKLIFLKSYYTKYKLLELLNEEVTPQGISSLTKNTPKNHTNASCAGFY